MTDSVGVKLGDLWNLAFRAKWVILGCLVASLSVAYVSFRMSPKIYKSSTTILVESQKIPERYVSGVVAGTVQERLSMIQQLVLSRTMLQKAMEELNLYQDQIKEQGLESVVEIVRKQIEIKTVGRGSVDAFTISFLHENPMTAMKVAAKLASQYIEENLKVREQLVEGASEFLTQELEKAKLELEEKDKKISEFKHHFMGELPGQLQTNLRTLDRLQADFTASQETQQKLADRISQTEQAIKEYESSGKPTFSKPRSSDPFDLPLKDLENQLAALSAEYKETYPDIVMLKERIRKMRAQPREVGADDDGSVKGDPYLIELRKQQAEARREVAALKDYQARLRRQIKEVEDRVERTPTREQELQTLIRDYDNLHNNYRSLVDKNLSARIAGNLEKRQKGEQFRIIDPANLPIKPEKPDLFRFMMVGLAVGCGLGFGYAFAAEQLRPVFRRADEVEGLLHLPVIAEIPAMRFAYTRTGKLLPLRPAVPRLSSRLAEQQAENGGVRKATRREWRRLLSHRRHAGNGDGWGRYRKRRREQEQDYPRQFALIAKWSPTSVVAEQFRVAVTKVVLMFAESACPVIGVTSAVKGEGKSAVAANLAYTLARDLAKRTLLIDCDFKSPTLHEYFEVPSEPGLVEVMADGRSVGECLIPIPGVPLWIVPGGKTQERMVELSKGPQLLSLLAGLRAQYDCIILDAPPILPLADMNVLSGMTDGLLMVIRAGRTQRRVVENAIHRLNQSNHLALILNDIDAAVMPYYMQYEYGKLPRAGAQA
jgi:succinoglycan biosynthesis transport protein ExoP